MYRYTWCIETEIKITARFKLRIGLSISCGFRVRKNEVNSQKMQENLFMLLYRCIGSGEEHNNSWRKSDHRKDLIMAPKSWPLLGNQWLKCRQFVWICEIKCVLNCVLNWKEIFLKLIISFCTCHGLRMSVDAGACPLCPIVRRCLELTIASSLQFKFK